MSSADAEDPTFVSDHSSTEFRNVECIAQRNFVGDHFFNVKEMDWFASPLKVVHELVWWVALLEDEGVMEKLIELINHVDFIVVGNPATQLA